MIGTGEGSSKDDRSAVAEEVAKAILSKKKYKEAEEISTLKPLPITPLFRDWKQETFEAVCSASGRPKLCLPWIRAVEKEGTTFESLADSGDFETLDAKLATALTKLLKKDDLKRKVDKAKERAKLCDTL